ncbi:hypothetical protein KD050_04650 [Psychrobacillus sp. INOP01]|uniref:DUF294 nucleotidyltransferase-like domain-containing protein n=1 Tax=Psychrobacillus sp. INOP01 TaxID=2829187 RepID=UPI001BAA7559|nr:DUF294 nucleotidyltransferase-like domain-containing protein [Psychrobacillus sp. INOP01]QUG42567.1 hypothetical protein KD050_04650 [Psychrobacillus sp. INOP01]
METYESIREWKELYITNFLDDIVSLNDFHDQVMLKVLEVATKKMKRVPAPCDFSWFITGSGGRLEQGMISDQDHGIAYEISNDENDLYFEVFGKEISYGLHKVGYPYCEGKVMSSNSRWCKSYDGWNLQLQDWVDDESWESIRYLQIFYDARVLHGKVGFIHQLKSYIHAYQLQHPNLLNLFTANVEHVKNVIGPLGQLLVERHGLYQGSVNLKYSGFLPYVNAIRLLSIREGILETSTLVRMSHLIQIREYAVLLKNTERNFSDLLKYRLSLSKVESYLDTHYLQVEKLTKAEQKDIKRIIKGGIKLHREVIALMKKGVHNGV